MDNQNIDNEQEMIALNFATRMLLTEFDRDVMIERSLESLVDFGRSNRAAILLLDQFGEKLIAEGSIISHVYKKESIEFDLEATPCKEVLTSKKPTFFNLVYLYDLPMPAKENGKPGLKCLCVPLVAADNKVIGVVTFELSDKITINSILTQYMVLLLTLVSMGLESLRLFRLAVNDGLTGLYVRRYFDIRLREEISRIKRYGGEMGLLVVDIDHFKKFNDTHGHQLGDLILKEVAKILKQSVRQSLDIVCRYGGEEFVVIMPNTNQSSALVVAERIRETCQDFVFIRNDTPLKVTLSGGVAFLNQETAISELEFFERADKALYLSKEKGRNKISIWGL